MPGGDRTGPMGYGPMTGRGAGFCAGFGAPGFMNQGFGWGRGFGGRGRGFRHMYWATGLPGWARYGTAPGWGGAHPTGAPSSEDELQSLKQQARAMEKSLSAIKKRMDELEEGGP